jgi:hypothetical protein
MLVLHRSIVGVLAGIVALPDLIARLRALGPDARVLVVGHSDTVPKILSALGSTQLVTIGSDEYDNLFSVLPRAAVTPTVLRLRY